MPEDNDLYSLYETQEPSFHQRCIRKISYTLFTVVALCFLSRLLRAPLQASDILLARGTAVRTSVNKIQQENRTEKHDPNLFSRNETEYKEKRKSQLNDLVPENEQGALDNKTSDDVSVSQTKRQNEKLPTKNITFHPEITSREISNQSETLTEKILNSEMNGFDSLMAATTVERKRNIKNESNYFHLNTIKEYDTSKKRQTHDVLYNQSIYLNGGKSIKRENASYGQIKTDSFVNYHPTNESKSFKNNSKHYRNITNLNEAGKNEKLDHNSTQQDHNVSPNVSDALDKNRPAKRNDPTQDNDLKGKSKIITNVSHDYYSKREIPNQSNASKKNVAKQNTEDKRVLDSTKTFENHSDTRNATESVNYLTKYLKFTNRTAINFMHFHKTGGVSFKVAMFRFFANKTKKNGNQVLYRDACYRRVVQKSGNVPGFVNWRCDWKPVIDETESDRNKLDVIFGHQYRVGGIESLLNKRDVRLFTVMRHPFDRKVSFFFHFFVRERGRSEKDVTLKEVKDFLLHTALKEKSWELGKEVGPNYMAGRLLSDGKIGFVTRKSHQFYYVPSDRKWKTSEDAINIIKKYVFIGLQSEPSASMCMMKKMVEEFNKAQGIVNTKTDKVALTAKVLNTGSYSLTGTKIWDLLSEEEKRIFEENEKIDLNIYRMGEYLFRKQVYMFGCGHLVNNSQYHLPV